MLNNQQVNAVTIELVEHPNLVQEEQIRKLQEKVFSYIDEKEVKEDFYHPAGVHMTEQLFKDKKIKLGGYGICVDTDYQGKGIGSLVSKKAMEYLKENGVEVAFLSIDPTNKLSLALHRKNGFIVFQRKFCWTNSNGLLMEDDGAMIAAVNSKELFEFILNSSQALYVGNRYR